MIKKVYIKECIDTLAVEGRRICKEAARTKEASNRKFNLLDAYGWAVYYNRKMERKGYANDAEKSTSTYSGWRAMGIPRDTGRNALNEFFDSYIPPSNEFVLIVVNAVFYSQILEDGSGTLRRSYRIVSQIADDFETLKKKYKGRVDVISPVGHIG